MEINQVVFSYDRKTEHLKRVSSSIEPGKVTTIIGPNGCGKSTLLGVMSKNMEPQSGEIVLDGKALSSYKPKELARRLAVVHQHNDAPADITVERLVSYGRMPHRGLLSQNKEEDGQAIEWALSRTRLLDKRTKPIDQLSGGERQRVWIAMSLAQRTPVLFLDEPTTYLDIYYQIELLELIRDLNVSHGLTIVMVLHDINQAIRYSDQIIVMKQGEIMGRGTPQEVINEQTMRDIYGVQVVVKQEQELGLYIVPVGI